MNKLKTSINATVATFALAVTSANAATTFITNTGGNAAALEGDAAGTVTGLTLSAEDGGGTINLKTIAIHSSGADPEELGMNTVSMGVSNEKWGTAFGAPGYQLWRFSFDQEIDFLGLGFIAGGGDIKMRLSSTAWAGETGTTGTGWSFSSTGIEGTFTINSADSPASLDFSSAGVSSIAADTEMTIAFDGAEADGGIQMTSFTIAAVPEPSSAAALFGVVGLCAVALRRRK